MPNQAFHILLDEWTNASEILEARRIILNVGFWHSNEGSSFQGHPTGYGMGSISQRAHLSRSNFPFDTELAALYIVDAQRQLISKTKAYELLKWCVYPKQTCVMRGLRVCTGLHHVVVRCTTTITGWISNGQQHRPVGFYPSRTTTIDAD